MIYSTLMIYTQKSRTRQRAFLGLGAQAESTTFGSLVLTPQVGGPPLFRFKIRKEVPLTILRGMTTQLANFYDGLDHDDPHMYNEFPSLVISSKFRGCPAHNFQVGRWCGRHGAYIHDYRDKEPLIFISRSEPRTVVVKNRYQALVSEFQVLLDRLEERLANTPFTQWDHLLGE